MSRGRGRKNRRPILTGLLLLLAGAVIGVLVAPRLRWPLPLPSPFRRAETPTPAPLPTRPAPAPKAEARPEPAPRAPADFEPAAPGRSAGVLALVIDDLGWDVAALRALDALPGPIGVAVIPSAPHAAEAAALARRHGWDLLVHLPMAPEKGTHEADAVGPGDDDAEIAARVTRALGRVPGAIGLNNHQGSGATADARVVRAVLSVVRDRGLFFLDSRTTASSVAEKEARALGVSTIGRDVFLDDGATEAADPGGAASALERAWEKAAATAARKGSCVAIGHPRPETLSFLARRLAAPGGPRLVRVSELVD